MAGTPAPGGGGTADWMVKVGLDLGQANRDLDALERRIRALAGQVGAARTTTTSGGGTATTRTAGGGGGSGPNAIAANVLQSWADAAHHIRAAGNATRQLGQVAQVSTAHLNALHAAIQNLGNVRVPTAGATAAPAALGGGTRAPRPGPGGVPPNLLQQWRDEDLFDRQNRKDRLAHEREIAGARAKNLAILNKIGKATWDISGMHDGPTGIIAKVWMWTAATTVVLGTLRGIERTMRSVAEIDLQQATLAKLIRGDRRQATYTAAKLTRKAGELGTMMGENVTDVQVQMQGWVRQGFDVAQTTRLTELSLRLQKATMLDAAQAAGFLTSHMRQYGLTVEQVAIQVDSLNQLENVMAARAEEVASAVSLSASVAKAKGVEIEELNAMMATVIEATQRPGSEVGRAYRTIYNRLYTPKVEKMVAAPESEGGMGIPLFFGAGGKTAKDAEKVLGELAAKWATLSARQKENLQLTLAGQRQSNFLIALFENWPRYLQAVTQQYMSMNSAVWEVSRNHSTLIGAVQRLKAAWQELISNPSVTGGLSQALKDLVNGLRVTVQEVERLDPQKIERWISRIIGISTGLGTTALSKSGWVGAGSLVSLIPHPIAKAVGIGMATIGPWLTGASAAKAASSGVRGLFGTAQRDPNDEIERNAQAMADLSQRMEQMGKLTGALAGGARTLEYVEKKLHAIGSATLTAKEKQEQLNQVYSLFGKSIETIREQEKLNNVQFKDSIDAVLQGRKLENMTIDQKYKLVVMLRGWEEKAAEAKRREMVREVDDQLTANKAKFSAIEIEQQIHRARWQAASALVDQYSEMGTYGDMMRPGATPAATVEGWVGQWGMDTSKWMDRNKARAGQAVIDVTVERMAEVAMRPGVAAAAQSVRDLATRRQGMADLAKYSRDEPGKPEGSPDVLGAGGKTQKERLNIAVAQRLGLPGASGVRLDLGPNPYDRTKVTQDIAGLIGLLALQDLREARKLGLQRGDKNVLPQVENLLQALDAANKAEAELKAVEAGVHVKGATAPAGAAVSAARRVSQAKLDEFNALAAKRRRTPAEQRRYDALYLEVVPIPRVSTGGAGATPPVLVEGAGDAQKLTLDAANKVFNERLRNILAHPESPAYDQLVGLLARNQRGDDLKAAADAMSGVQIYGGTPEMLAELGRSDVLGANADQAKRAEEIYKRLLSQRGGLAGKLSGLIDIGNEAPSRESADKMLAALEELAPEFEAFRDELLKYGLASMMGGLEADLRYLEDQALGMSGRSAAAAGGALNRTRAAADSEMLSEMFGEDGPQYDETFLRGELAGYDKYLADLNDRPLDERIRALSTVSTLIQQRFGHLGGPQKTMIAETLGKLWQQTSTLTEQKKAEDLAAMIQESGQDVRVRQSIQDADQAEAARIAEARAASMLAYLDDQARIRELQDQGVQSDEDLARQRFEIGMMGAEGPQAQIAGILYGAGADVRAHRRGVAAYRERLKGEGKEITPDEIAEQAKEEQRIYERANMEIVSAYQSRYLELRRMNREFFADVLGNVGNLEKAFKRLADQVMGRYFERMIQGWKPLQGLVGGMSGTMMRGFEGGGPGLPGALMGAAAAGAAAGVVAGKKGGGTPNIPGWRSFGFDTGELFPVGMDPTAGGDITGHRWAPNGPRGGWEDKQGFWHNGPQPGVPWRYNPMLGAMVPPDQPWIDYAGAGKKRQNVENVPGGGGGGQKAGGWNPPKIGGSNTLGQGLAFASMGMNMQGGDYANNILSGAAQGFSVGGPWGAAGGAALGLVMSIFGKKPKPPMNPAQPIQLPTASDIRFGAPALMPASAFYGGRAGGFGGGGGGAMQNNDFRGAQFVFPGVTDADTAREAGRQFGAGLSDSALSLRAERQRGYQARY